MNKIFRVIWSKARSEYVVVGESVKANRAGCKSQASSISVSRSDSSFAITRIGCAVVALIFSYSVNSYADQIYVGGIFTSLGGGGSTNPTCYSTAYSPYGNSNGGVASGFSGITQDNISSGPTGGINYYG